MTPSTAGPAPTPSQAARALTSALFGDRVQPVTVTVGDGANDGEPGESDDVLDDVETVIGGGASDSLAGSDGADSAGRRPRPGFGRRRGRQRSRAGRRRR